jgi:delta 1-pyrroline-5-carboxylate dehydrogenase
VRLTHHRSAASTVKVLIIVFVCLALVGLAVVGVCAFAGFSLFKTVSKELEGAQAAGNTFFDQIVAGQEQQAYQSTTADYQAQLTFVQFRAFVVLQPNLKNHSSRSQSGFNMQTVNGVKSATLQYTLNGPSGASNCTLVLQDSGSGWKVHKLTFP